MEGVQALEGPLVFVDSQNEAVVFRSAASALAYFEPNDLLGDEYRGYDQSGRVLRLVEAGRSQTAERRGRSIDVAVLPDSQSDEALVKQDYRRILLSAGLDAHADFESMSLEDVTRRLIAELRADGREVEA